MPDTPETIYLIPGEDVDGAPCMVWCDDPAPSYACDPAEAVAYVRKDKHDEIIARQARAATMGMDAAKKSGHAMYEHGRKMLAESRPESLESERAMNEHLTIEAMQARDIIADLVEYIDRQAPGDPNIKRAKAYLGGSRPMTNNHSADCFGIRDYAGSEGIFGEDGGE